MIKRWDIITIGNVSRNRYWGEGDEAAQRSVLCTCTLIVADDFRMLVDPSVGDAEGMAHALDRRSGLKPADIDLIFVTHAHGDHHWGAKHFPDAQWLAAPETVTLIISPSRLLETSRSWPPAAYFSTLLKRLPRICSNTSASKLAVSGAAASWRTWTPFASSDGP